MIGARAFGWPVMHRLHRRIEMWFGRVLGSRGLVRIQDCDREGRGTTKACERGGEAVVVV